MLIGLGCACLLAMGFAVAPRLFLILAWIFSERWDRVWQGNWIAPLLGIMFLPYTTIMCMLVWTPTGIAGWDWLWIGLGVLLDVIRVVKSIIQGGFFRRQSSSRWVGNSRPKSKSVQLQTQQIRSLEGNPCLLRCFPL